MWYEKTFTTQHKKNQRLMTQWLTGTFIGIAFPLRFVDFYTTLYILIHGLW